VPGGQKARCGLPCAVTCAKSLVLSRGSIPCAEGGCGGVVVEGGCGGVVVDTLHWNRRRFWFLPPTNSAPQSPFVFVFKWRVAYLCHPACHSPLSPRCRWIEGDAVRLGRHALTDYSGSAFEPLETRFFRAALTAARRKGRLRFGSLIDAKVCAIAPSCLPFVLLCQVQPHVKLLFFLPRVSAHLADEPRNALTSLCADDAPI